MSKIFCFMLLSVFQSKWFLVFFRCVTCSRKGWLKIIKNSFQKVIETSQVFFFSDIHICTNLYRVESLLFKHSAVVLTLCKTNLNASVSTTESSVPGYLSLCQNDSRVYMHDLGVYIWENELGLLYSSEKGIVLSSLNIMFC